MFYEDDIDIFFDTYEFAKSANLVSAGAGSKTIKVIFENNYQDMNIYTGIVESAGPQAQAKTSDVTGAAHGDTLEIDNITYYIKGIQPNGTGITILILSKDS